MRLQRGERVVGDLRLGRRHGRDQRRLPRVGEPHQRHVGHQLELHVQPELLALLALLGERRRPPAVGEEARVAPPALAAFGHHEAGALGRQVAHHGAASVAHHGTDRHRAPPGPCPVRRDAWTPSRARRRWRGGTGDPGNRAATTRSRDATSHTSPPWPPSPPSGPPRSTWASRRHDTAPAPPSPARACSWAWSTNPDMVRKPKSRGVGGRAVPPPPGPVRRRPACTVPPRRRAGRRPTRRSPGSPRRPTRDGRAARHPSPTG